jgi:hypothetical protein
MLCVMHAPEAKVYLDQNMWIGLMRANRGDEAGRRFLPLLEAARTAVASRTALFVLSFSNYEENWRRGVLADRKAVAEVMWELARTWRIATPQDVVRWEVEASLRRIFDRPKVPFPEVFGHGIGHVFNEDVLTPLVSSLKLPTTDPSTRAHLSAIATNVLEIASIIGPDGDYRDLGITRPGRERNEKYAAQRNQLRSNLRGWRQDKDGAERFATASELVELIEIVDEVGDRLGVSMRHLTRLGRDALDDFLSSLPLESIVRKLHEAALRDDRTTQVNDHNDVVYLSAAAAYCDIVAGERHWTEKPRRPTTPTRAGHIVSRPEDLVALLTAL